MSRYYGRFPIANPGVEIIPAIPDAPQYDKFGRESAFYVREQRNSADTTVLFDVATGELRFDLKRNLVEPDNFNKTLAYFRSEHGRDAVKMIVLFVCQETYREHYDEFRLRGYVRDITREKPNSLAIALAKSPATQWDVLRRKS